ncbi:MAG: sugar phosphate isomerase/epimerase [candidate division WS1 bacterium]|nr:sugar phosphate isomerase/epimerase [candidate division WS1 bacterium]
MPAPIALQLFSVRGECEKDLPGTLQRVAEIGYAAAEPWGYTGEALEWMGTSAKDLRSAFDDAGLACCGFHLATAALMDERIATTIEMNRILGNDFLIISADEPRMSSREGIMELAGILNAAANRLAPEGMWAGYHAHGFDFRTVDGEVAWNILFANTDDAVVMQMDIGNCMQGGGDPMDALRRFPGRARSMHIKEFGQPEGGTIGDGQMDWPVMLDLIKDLHSPKWYVVEEPGPEGLGFDIPARAYQALRKLGL